MGSEPNGSPAGKFSWTDLGKTVLPTVTLGAIAALQYLQDNISGMELGWWGPILLTAVAGSLIALKKYATDTRKP